MRKTAHTTDLELASRGWEHISAQELTVDVTH